MPRTSDRLAQVAIGVGMVIPFGLLHYLDYRRNYWGVAGRARKVTESARGTTPRLQSQNTAMQVQNSSGVAVDC